LTEGLGNTVDTITLSSHDVEHCGEASAEAAGAGFKREKERPCDGQMEELVRGECETDVQSGVPDRLDEIIIFTSAVGCDLMHILALLGAAVEF